MECQPCFVEPALGEGDHRVVQFAAGVVYVSAVQLQEDKSSTEARSRVAVQEGLALSDVKGVCGRPLEKGEVDVLSSEARLGCGDGGLQQAAIPDTDATAEEMQ